MAEFKRLAHDQSAAGEKFDEALEALNYPDVPEEIFCRDDDMATLRWHFYDVDWRTQREWWGNPERIQRLRDDDYSQYEHPIHRKAEARRDEIVTAWDGWQDGRKAAEDCSGYTAARDESCVASERYEAFRLRLIHMRTTDPDILAVKVAVVAEAYTYNSDGVVHLDGPIARFLEEPGDDYEALAFSIVRDLALRAGSAT